MSDLLSAAELAPQFHVSTFTFLKWKREGKITAEVDTGRTILFDPEKVRKQLAKAVAKPTGRPSKTTAGMVPTY